MVYRPPWSVRVTSRVRAHIVASGLSKSKIAELSKIPKTTFFRRYDGTDAWNTRELERVAKVLQMDPIDLVSCDAPKRGNS